jgi:hypothetical protein
MVKKINETRRRADSIQKTKTDNEMMFINKVKHRMEQDEAL